MSDTQAVGASAGSQRLDGAAARHPRHRLTHRRLVVIMTALMLCLLLQALDQTMVALAMPRIVASLHGFDLYAWVVTSYVLGSTVLLPIAGRLSDQFGRKHFVLGGVAIFLVGSALSGQAQSMHHLVIYRAIQGAAAGAGITMVYSVVGDLFEPRERAKWGGFFGAVYGFASFAGPTLGGWLADNGPLVGHFITEATRWRWVFYIHLPFGLIAFAVLALVLPHDLSERVTRERGWAAVRRIDFGGAALSAAATISLMLALTWTSIDAAGWLSLRVLAGFAAAFILFGGFIAHERRTTSEAILPRLFFQIRDFRNAASYGLLVGMVWLSVIFYLPLFLQGVVGQSAASAGLAMLPLTIAQSIYSSGVGYMLRRTGGRYRGWATFGAAALALSLLGMTRMGASSPEILVSALMIGIGVGVGVFMPVTSTLAQIVVPRSMLGAATNAIGYLRSVGQMLGVALVGAIVQTSLGDHAAPLAALRSGVKVEGLEAALQNGLGAIAIFALLLLVAVRLARNISIFGEDAVGRGGGSYR
jgi:EmrB/QacA subfamily drug resistance transporter